MIEKFLMFSMQNYDVFSYLITKALKTL